MNTFFPADAGDTAGGVIGIAFGCVAVLIELGLIVLIIAGMWKMFVKAGEPGWASIVPIYNTIIMLKIAGKPLWWIILMFIPCVGFFVAIVVLFELAKSFGKGVGYTVGMILLPFIFIPMLGFGSAQYQGTKSF